MKKRNAMQQKSQQAPDQERAIELYAQGATDAEVASELGIDRTTAWRWRTQDAEFGAALRQAQNDAVKAAVARLEGFAAKALDVFDAILTDHEALPALRLRAAETVLERVGAAKALIDLADSKRVRPARSPLELLVAVRKSMPEMERRAKAEAEATGAPWPLPEPEPEPEDDGQW